ncbi:hypothetical protein WMO13_09475 [Ignatzschineria larvae DSM 13226]|uniref:Uncharacterized protein n=1 Tax=Ignatzschineria larvae DSM 13226 TaxID=1111732 RepID=A0ABZ3BYH3_9GAMM
MKTDARREGIIAQPEQPSARARVILNLSAMNQIPTLNFSNNFPAFKIFHSAKAPELPARDCRKNKVILSGEAVNPLMKHL